MASPVFKDTLTLPQPEDSGSVDVLPMVQLKKDSELLDNLFSILYCICTVIILPISYEKV